MHYFWGFSVWGEKIQSPIEGILKHDHSKSKISMILLLEVFRFFLFRTNHIKRKQTKQNSVKCSSESSLPCGALGPPIGLSMRTWRKKNTAGADYKTINCINIKPLNAYKNVQLNPCTNIVWIITHNCEVIKIPLYMPTIIYWWLCEVNIF